MSGLGLFGGGSGSGRGYYPGYGYGYGGQEETFGGELTDALAGVSAMSKLKDVFDTQAVNSRLDKMAKVMGENGGDISAITPDMYSDRNGVAAYASLVKAWRDTEAGKDAVRKSLVANAANQYNMFTTHAAQIEKMIQAGDAQSASLAMENLSRQAHIPYELKFNAQDGTFDVLHNTPEGAIPTGQKMSMGDAWSTVQGLIKNQKEFMKQSMIYAQAVAEGNLDNAMNPERTLIARNDKGEELHLVPNVELPYGQAPKVGYYSPKMGRTLTKEELAQAGFNIPTSIKTAQADEALDLKAEANTIRAEAAAQRANDAAARLSMAEENAALRRELGNASLSKSDAAAEDDIFDQIIEQSVPGAFKKNKSWFVEGDDGEAHVVEAAVIAAARKQARAMVEKQTGRKRPESDEPAAPAFNPAKAFLDKALGRK
jgi:hypothetical protein